MKCYTTQTCVNVWAIFLHLLQVCVEVLLVTRSNEWLLGNEYANKIISNERQQDDMVETVETLLTTNAILYSLMVSPFASSENMVSSQKHVHRQHHRSSKKRIYNEMMTVFAEIPREYPVRNEDSVDVT